MEQDKDLVFDEKEHKYYYKNISVPGITSVLHSEGLTDYTFVHPYYMKRGEIVHKIIELHCKGALVYGSIDEKVKGYFDSFLEYEKLFEYKPTVIEMPLYHSAYQYATKSDGYGEGIVVNYKTGNFREADFIQLAAEIEIHRNNKLECKEGHLVYLDKKGGLPKVEIMKIRGKKYKRHLNIFLSALTLFKFKRENK